ncbi:MAG: hypothetical protein LBV51_03960 [Acholeplasmatales bacterium]|jgi:hypothetical protein|nr:hypothetical protein [Acholeplasmatales bacterium]
MIGHFKYVNKIKFALCKETFTGVYYDRFNSIFKGFYLVVRENSMSNVESIDALNNNVFIKIPSTECFGSQDVLEVEEVEEHFLSEKQKRDIKLLNLKIK